MESVLGQLGRWAQRGFYYSLQVFARLAGVLFFEMRCYGRENLRSGAALILSTHQSHLDPVLVGIAFNDRLAYLARRTLFKNAGFAALIRVLDAIELDRDRGGLAGLKETLRRLKSGQKVLLFPEGTRTPDGRIQPLKPGFLAVARRSRAPLIPLAITGAYEALPRNKVVPKRYPIRLAIGEGIEYADYESLTDEQALELIQDRLSKCRSTCDFLRRL